MAERHDLATDYERSDVSVRLVAALAGGLVATLIALPLILYAAFPRAAGDRHPGAAMALPPPPRLQVSSKADLEAFRRAEDAILSSYGWIDRDSGVVRIPIDRAMADVAARGLDGWQKAK
jgi:hypothetical protein